MWFLDGEEYYDPPGARYLTYDNDVRQFVDSIAAERHGGAMPLFYKHMVALSYQLGQFRCGVCLRICQTQGWMHCCSSLLPPINCVLLISGCPTPPPRLN